MKTENTAIFYRKKRFLMVKKHHTKHLLSSVFIATLLAACAAPPIADVADDVAKTPIPAAWMHAHHDAQTAQHRAWWHNFADPELDHLIAQALAHNHNLATALTGWRQALTATDSADARAAPQYSGDISARANRDFQANRNSHSFSANFSASYQLDLWKKAQAQRESAALSADAAGEDYLAARLALAGQVAKAYFQLRHLDDQIRWNAHFAQNARRRLETARERHKAGSISRLELVQEMQTLTNLERDAQNLAGQRAQAQTALGILLGQAPHAPALSEKKLTDYTVPAIPAGLPAHLLAQRPDLRAAQYRLQGALADIAVAERDFYPDISLSASLGGSSPALIRILQNPAAGLGAALSLPFLQYREKEIALLNNKLAYEKSLHAFRHSLYQAFADVENALVRRDTLSKEAQVLETQLAQARDIENLTQIRYEAGAASLQEALDAKNSREQSESAQLANHFNQIDAAIDLYLSLGGNTSLSTP